MTTVYKLGKGSKKVYNSGLHRDLKRIIDGALEVAPIDFTLVSGKRYANDQFDLFKIGRRFEPTKGWQTNTLRKPLTNPNAWVETGAGVVTYADGFQKLSRHQSGEAFDFQCYIPGRPDLNYNRIHMAVLIGSFLTVADTLYRQGEVTHGLRSGADWDGDTQYLEPGTFIDMPHLQLIQP